jgi:hypothetical protein
MILTYDKFIKIMLNPGSLQVGSSAVKRLLYCIPARVRIDALSRSTNIFIVFCVCFAFVSVFALFYALLCVFCSLGVFFACTIVSIRRSASRGSKASFSDLLCASWAAIGLRNRPSSDARCKDSAQRYFVGRFLACSSSFVAEMVFKSLCRVQK